jgi:GTPase SAR1 family protein
MFVFSLVDPASLWDVREFWCLEVHHHCPNTPFILVGTKSDLRDSATCKSSFVSTAQGTAMALSIGARVYVECSAFKQEGIQNVLDQAVLSVLLPNENRNKHKRCSVM